MNQTKRSYPIESLARIVLFLSLSISTDRAPTRQVCRASSENSPNHLLGQCVEIAEDRLIECVVRHKRHRKKPFRRSSCPCSQFAWNRDHSVWQCSQRLFLFQQAVGEIQEVLPVDVTQAVSAGANVVACLANDARLAQRWHRRVGDRILSENFEYRCSGD
jgi:hypothetical protein